MILLDKGDVITLSSGQEYVIAELIDYKDQEYLMLFETKEEMLFEQAKFVKTEYDKENHYSIMNIDDSEELHEVINIFLPLFQEDYVELK